MQEINSVSWQNQVQVVITRLILLQYYVSLCFLQLIIVLAIVRDQIRLRAEQTLHMAVHIIVL